MSTVELEKNGGGGGYLVYFGTLHVVWSSFQHFLLLYHFMLVSYLFFFRQ